MPFDGRNEQKFLDLLAEDDQTAHLQALNLLSSQIADDLSGEQSCQVAGGNLPLLDRILERRVDDQNFSIQTLHLLLTGMKLALIGYRDRHIPQPEVDAATQESLLTELKLTSDLYRQGDLNAASERFHYVASLLLIGVPVSPFWDMEISSEDVHPVVSGWLSGVMMILAAKKSRQLNAAIVES